MGKIILWILVAYVFYYGAMIIYDLFFKKEKILATEEGQIINMNHDDDEPPDDIRNIEIDDVENVEVPNSFIADEDQIFQTDESLSNHDAEALRKDYEDEEELLKYSASEEQEKRQLEQENHEKKQIVSQLFKTITTPAENFISSTKEVISNALADDSFDDILNRATSHVVMTSNIEGHKVFKSTLNL